MKWRNLLYYFYLNESFQSVHNGLRCDYLLKKKKKKSVPPLEVQDMVTSQPWVQMIFALK